MNTELRNKIYGARYPGFWGFLTNIGIDFNREEICPGK
jgi:hypothetical protein